MVSKRVSELVERLRIHVALFTNVLVPFVRDGVLLPLSAPPERGGYGERSPSFQLSTPDGRHVVAAFVLEGGARPQSVAPRALNNDVSYRVTDLATGRADRVTGSEITSRGIPLTGAPSVTSWLLLIEPTTT